MDKRIITILAMMVLWAFGAAGAAQAATYGFQVLNDYSDDDDYTPAQAALAAAAQDTAQHLGMEVTGAGSTATFRFANSAPSGNGAAVTAIYWDFGSYNGAFSATPALAQSPGVSFSQLSHLNFPQGNTIGFDEAFGIGRTGNVSNGINGGEWLAVSWLLDGLDIDGLIAAIDSGRIRVGMHVQSLPDPDASSMSVVNKTPIPGAAWLLGTGLLGLLGLRRKPRN